MKTILMISMICILSACAGSGGDPVLSPTTPQNPTVNSSGYISVGNVKVAYVYDLDSDFAELYIPSADRYASVNITTGAYAANAFFNYTGANCTGTARASGFNGAANKAVVFDGSNYYRISSSNLGSFTFQSFGSVSSCSNSASTFSQSFSVELISRPYDFQSIAPLNIQFQ